MGWFTASTMQPPLALPLTDAQFETYQRAFIAYGRSGRDPIMPALREAQEVRKLPEIAPLFVQLLHSYEAHRTGRVDRGNYLYERDGSVPSAEALETEVKDNVYVMKKVLENDHAAERICAEAYKQVDGAIKTALGKGRFF